MTYAFSRITKECGEILSIEGSDAIMTNWLAGKIVKVPAQVIGNLVGGRHGVANREILKHQTLRGFLEWINVVDIKAQVR